MSYQEQLPCPGQVLMLLGPWWTGSKSYVGYVVISLDYKIMSTMVFIRPLEEHQWYKVVWVVRALLLEKNFYLLHFK